MGKSRQPKNKPRSKRWTSSKKAKSNAKWRKRKEEAIDRAKRIEALLMSERFAPLPFVEPVQDKTKCRRVTTYKYTLQQFGTQDGGTTTELWPTALGETLELESYLKVLRDI